MNHPVDSPDLVAVPATPPPALSPGTRTALRAAVVIVAVLLLLGGIGGLAAAAVGVGNIRVVADTQPLPATMRSLTLDTTAAPMAVRIKPDPDAREPRVEVRLVNGRGAEERSLDITSGPDADTRITVRGSAPDWMKWARAGELTVVVPPQLGRRLTVTTEQELGVLEVDADLDRLVARSSSGAVILRGSARSVQAEVRHGAVIADAPILVREAFSANVTEGDISVDFRGVAPRTVEVSSSDGDVTLGLPGDGPYLVSATSGPDYDAAVVRVPQTTNRDEAESVVMARASGGDVVIDGVD
ncbi:hypothetical protein [Mycolicibacterium mengxianglii]|uniref:hypothetical protein n=1 Tax=Mycolicibacterium mengxianglii TaxID=2736649 RepID=UPI0018D0B1E0|nr:hypothetical protein [Mycolicibacterium mengxianglii]